MGKNGTPPFLRFNNKSFNKNAGEIIRRIMTAFDIQTVTPGQVGRFFEKSSQKGGVILRNAGFVIVKRDRNHIARYAQQESRE